MPRVDNLKFTSGKSTYLDVLARYFAMRLMERSCTRRGLLQNYAHWCTAIDIYGRVDPLI